MSLHLFTQTKMFILKKKLLRQVGRVVNITTDDSSPSQFDLQNHFLVVHLLQIWGTSQLRRKRGHTNKHNVFEQMRRKNNMEGLSSEGLVTIPRTFSRGS